MASLPVTSRPAFDLRDYQNRTIDAGRDALTRSPSVLITAPTGAGKTVMMSHMIRLAALRGLRSDIVVHREELIEQSQTTVSLQTGILPGIVWQNTRQWDEPIRILSHGTLAAMERLPRGVETPHLLFLDEAHHGTAPGWRHAVGLMEARWLIGYTATPFRHDREPLVPDPFAEVIRTITPQELINLGVLVPPVVVSPAVSDLTGNPQPIGQARNIAQIYLDAIRYAIGRGRTKIILFVSANGGRTPTQTMEETQLILEEAGIQCGAISEDCSSRERKRITTSFEKMPTSVLLNYMTLTEGFDSKCVDCIVLGRQTRSESTLIQMIGRGLRQYPGKTSCLVINFTGRHDVNNIINYWRLDGDPKADPEPGPPRTPQPSEKQLDDLTHRFPDIVSAIGDTQIQYPWLKPFSDRRLRALCMWDPDRPERGETYVCVEPTPDRQWQVTRVRVPSQRRQEIRCLSRSGLSSAEAARAVQSLVGDQQRIFSRSAQWRRQPATERQRRTWRSIHDTDPPDNLTKGDASDAISLITFQERVSPKLF